MAEAATTEEAAGIAAENLAKAEKIGPKIANNKHTSAKHEKEFEEHGIPSRAELDKKIQETVQHGERKALRNGRTGYYDRENNFFVSDDPLKSEGGSAFFPTDGSIFWDELE